MTAIGIEPAASYPRAVGHTTMEMPIAVVHGRPGHVRMVDGFEMTAHALCAWARMGNRDNRRRAGEPLAEPLRREFRRAAA